MWTQCYSRLFVLILFPSLFCCFIHLFVGDSRAGGCSVFSAKVVNVLENRPSGKRRIRFYAIAYNFAPVDLRFALCASKRFRPIPLGHFFY